MLERLHHYLHEKDRSIGILTKYTHLVTHFHTRYEQEERPPLILEVRTPIALIGYHNELHHAQHKSISTINLRISALRARCCWMTEHGYLAADPAANIKLIGGGESTKRSGLNRSQINALLRQIQISRDKKRNNDVVHLSLQVIHHSLTQINLPAYHEAQDQPYLD